MNILYPNLGMLANSHLGLTNIIQKGGMRTRYSRINNRKLNSGSGATTPYDGLSFQTKFDSEINVGDEIFVDYGYSYFHGRESVWNMYFPTDVDYKTADDILENFKLEWGEGITSDESQRKWTETHLLLGTGRFQLPKKDDEEEEESNDENETDVEKKEKLKTQKRIAYALPRSVNDIHHVSEIGTARHSVPDSTRSIEYLQENGVCLDNLRKGKSKIPQAGNGAFAMNNLEKDSIISPVPLVPILRDHLDMYYDDDVKSQQIILNYCFGHPQSSLLFFPYSSTVHYINHDNVNPNAYIRWSKSEMNKDEMFDKEVKDVYTGLIMEVVALRDISIGEEITIDYGSDWTNAWYEHSESWDVPVDEFQINPQSIIETLMKDDGSEKKPYRTINEQEENPYPHCIRTACFSEEKNGTWIHTKPIYDYMRFCDVIDRVHQGDNYWYVSA